MDIRGGFGGGPKPSSKKTSPKKSSPKKSLPTKKRKGSPSITSTITSTEGPNATAIDPDIRGFFDGEPKPSS